MDVFSSPAFKIITLVTNICVIYFIFSFFTAKTRDRKSNENKINITGANDIATSPVVNNAIFTDTLTAEMVAVITAAVMSSIESNNTGLRVKSIKRIGHTTPIWNVAGRNEYILTRL